ncbi:MAG: hypothetical protein ACRDAM_12070 [Casimicrobium sp.]
MKKTIVSCFAVAFTLAASAANAQQSNARPDQCDDPNAAKKPTIAELKDLVGNVLVTNEANISSAAPGLRIPNKVRVTTTAQAGVVVSFDCGCDVKLKENERFDVDAPRGCGAMLALVQPVTAGVALGTATTGAAVATTGTTAGLLTVGAVGVGGYAQLRRSRAVSPN